MVSRIAVGLTRLDPSDDTIEMTADHAGDVLHRIGFQAHDVRAPLLEHFANDVDLLAIENLAYVEFRVGGKAMLIKFTVPVVQPL